MNNVTLNHLKLRPLLIFDRVLRHHSIAHAAKALNLTQPAVTKAIRELEDQLDTILFERSNRGVVPTDCALILGERVKSVLAELRLLADELNTFKGGETGHVVVGTLISASAKLLPQAIMALKEKHPKVLISVRVGTVNQLFPALAVGELDLVVGRLPEEALDIDQNFPVKHEVLYQERLSLVVGSQHPVLQAASLTYQDLADYPWILPPPESPMRRIATRFFRDMDMELPVNIVESLSLMTNINLMIDGNWVALMPKMAAQRFVSAGLLSFLPLDEVGQLVEVGVTTRHGKTLTPACSQLIACLKEVGMTSF